MIKIRKILWDKTSPEERVRLLTRPVQLSDSALSEKVRQIIQTVKKEKDAALFKYTSEFDKVSLFNLRVAPQEISNAYAEVKPATLSALKQAIQGVSTFHEAQLPKS